MFWYLLKKLFGFCCCQTLDERTPEQFGRLALIALLNEELWAGFTEKYKHQFMSEDICTILRKTEEEFSRDKSMKSVVYMYSAQVILITYA